MNWREAIRLVLELREHRRRREQEARRRAVRMAVFNGAIRHET